MAYKNGQYWDDRHDEAMRVLYTTPNDSKEWLAAYRVVLPRLKKMAQIILKRYYSEMDRSAAQDLVTDAMTHVLINGEYNPSKPKMYGYVGTIMKRYYYSELISPTLRLLSVNNRIDRNYDINDSEWVIDNCAYQPEFENIITERQEQLNIILERIDKGIAHCEEVLERVTKRNDVLGIQGSIREKEVLVYAREYFVENFLETIVSAISLVDYISARIDVPEYIISRYLIKYFGIGSQPSLMDNRMNTINYIERHGASSYMMDDYAPNEVAVSITRRQRNKTKLTGYEYF